MTPTLLQVFGNTPPFSLMHQEEPHPHKAGYMYACMHELLYLPLPAHTRTRDTSGALAYGSAIFYKHAAPPECFSANPNHPITQSLNHPITQSPNHSITQSPNHSITQSPNHPTSPTFIPTCAHHPIPLITPPQLHGR
jgi:hypothetical protein